MHMIKNSTLNSHGESEDNQATRNEFVLVTGVHSVLTEGCSALYALVLLTCGTKIYIIQCNLVNTSIKNCQLPKPGDRSDFNTHKTC